MSERTATIGGESLPLIATGPWHGLRAAALGLAFGSIALAFLFHVEIVAAVRTWVESTAYNHCFLVIPIAAWLVWDRSASLRGMKAAPIPLAALLALPLGAVWLAAERLGIMEGRQLVAITLLEVLFFAVLGRALYLAVLGPLLYLYFLVPFGAFLTPHLQDVTTWFTRHGLEIIGIPAYIDGYTIEIPEGTFFVAEACAGLRFLIASIAFGALYAIVMYRSPWRRLAFIGASIVVPIVANGIRALGIVVLGHILGSAEAAAADHLVYGWIFFSIVILLLTLVGLPFREDTLAGREASPPASPRLGTPRLGTPHFGAPHLGMPRLGASGFSAPHRGLIAGLAVAVLASIGPVAVFGLDLAAAAPKVAPVPLSLAPSCLNLGDPAAVASNPLGRAISQRMDCGGIKMTIHIEVFSPRSTAAPINAERRRMTRPPDAVDATDTAISDGSDRTRNAWHLIRADEPGFVALAGMWIDGKPASPGMAMRLEMAGTSLSGGSFDPVLIVIAPDADGNRLDRAPRGQAELRILADRMLELVRDHPEIGDRVRALAMAAAR